VLWIALLLGVVEGITEFLPISSTGHLILVAYLVGFEGPRAEVFEIFIQLGAILAVVWEYRQRLWGEVVGLRHRPESRSFAVSLAVAFLPAALLGLATHGLIAEHLFGPRTVAAALIAGALLIFLVEGIRRKPSVQVAERTGPRRALLIGLFQCLSLWPGFSRSAATIVGGLIVGLDRKAATEFSFFLAIPTMGAATVYHLVKNHQHLEQGDLGWLALSFAVSFLVAWGSIRWLIRFVATHTLRPFAWYRIAVGLAVLFLLT
jgi:undecaprenyl-diphosphatase